MDLLEKTLIDVVKWQNDTFPGANPLSKIYHLREEVDEIINDFEENRDVSVIELEYADCFLLLFGSAYKFGLNYSDINRIINKKLEICKNRQWEKPDKNGVVKHIKT